MQSIVQPVHSTALSTAQRDEVRDQGWTIVRRLITPAEAAARIDHYMAVRASGPKPGDYGGDPQNPGDPLNAFPRLINQHQWDALSQTWCNDPRLSAVAAAAIGQGAVLHQSMLYYKPPGARGQALHQDANYIAIDPLVGVWVALDRADQGNGGMVMVPGSHRLGLQPVVRADATDSFTPAGVAVPAGHQKVPIDLDPGDAVVFTGQVIHGSPPNRSADRFRRSFICHFIGERAEHFTSPAGTNVRHLAP